jgi:hypothetical protein
MSPWPSRHVLGRRGTARVGMFGLARQDDIVLLVLELGRCRYIPISKIQRPIPNPNGQSFSFFSGPGKKHS